MNKKKLWVFRILLSVSIILVTASCKEKMTCSGTVVSKYHRSMSHAFVTFRYTKNKGYGSIGDSTDAEGRFSFNQFIERNITFVSISATHKDSGNCFIESSQVSPYDGMELVLER